MLTTLVSIFLSIFGALRAAPLYYSRILTLGSTLLASLGDGTVLPTIDSLSATNARTPVRVLRLPPSLVRLTLPGSPPSHLVGPLLALLAAIVTITVVLSGFIWHLRTLALALTGSCDDTSINAGDPEKILYTIIDFSGVTYNGNVLTSDVELAGLFAGTTVLDPSLPFDAHISSTPIFKFEAPAASPQCTVGREDHENVTLASSESTSSLLPPTPPPTPVSTPSSTTIDLVAALVELTSAIEEDEEDTWDTWTNRRRRRPPTRAPPSDPRAWRSRSLSVFATPRTSRPLFSPAKQPLRPLPTRTRTTRSVASYNKFSVLEMLDAEE
ncbi:hypothetical protein TRAPUB_1928 [Trametes pubescens]|uniref:Uncharacterized protein n=1 Tax=Trametes pubescens TaxID=154538 RepID=A0A1M2V825_TRAPU|nr:hypothetical protein TRAPUB_5642 [Trametes pubescens]OJT07193.1 hypothetical protein TRAPUB_1949 [Trametes pubescens]OJT07197.1 hypothetical protein TRAPUB_1953 [Trametes pubescens]OJT07198.1 hypothetical protein TRAPUB_1928 [Trametes pubescens]